MIKNIFSLDGVKSVFLSDDYLSVNKSEEKDWEDLKHIIISFINEYYSKGNKCIISDVSKFKKDKDIALAAVESVGEDAMDLIDESLRKDEDILNALSQHG